MNFRSVSSACEGDYDSECCTDWVQRKVKASTNLSYWSSLSVFRNLWQGMYVNLAKLSLSVHVTNHPIFFVYPFVYVELHVTLRTLYVPILIGCSAYSFPRQPLLVLAILSWPFPSSTIQLHNTDGSATFPFLPSPPSPDALVQIPVTNTSIVIEKLLVPLHSLSLAPLSPGPHQEVQSVRMPVPGVTL